MHLAASCLGFTQRVNTTVTRTCTHVLWRATPQVLDRQFALDWRRLHDKQRFRKIIMRQLTPGASNEDLEAVLDEVSRPEGWRVDEGRKGLSNVVGGRSCAAANVSHGTHVLPHVHCFAARQLPLCHHILHCLHTLHGFCLHNDRPFTCWPSPPRASAAARSSAPPPGHAAAGIQLLLLPGEWSRWARTAGVQGQWWWCTARGRGQQWRRAVMPRKCVPTWRPLHGAHRRP